MAAGPLRYRLTLEQRAQATSGVTIANTFPPVATVWAQIEGVRGAVYADRVQVGEGATHRIMIRYRDRTDFDHASTPDGRRWKVRDVRDPTGRRQWLEIAAEELTAEVEP